MDMTNIDFSVFADLKDVVNEAREIVQQGVMPISVGADEAGKLIGVSGSTIRNLMKEGELEGHVAGGKVVVKVDDLRAFVEASPKAYELKRPELRGRPRKKDE